jgi:hypothetical protein
MVFLLDNLASSFIFIKTEIRRNEPINWLVCVDGSANSFSAYAQTLALARENDSVSVVYVKENANESVKRQIMERIGSVRINRLWLTFTR